MFSCFRVLGVEKLVSKQIVLSFRVLECSAGLENVEARCVRLSVLGLKP